MSLYKRLHDSEEGEEGAPAQGRSSGRDPALDELRHRVHSSLIEELGRSSMTSV